MRILVCGSRYWTDRNAIERNLRPHIVTGFGEVDMSSTVIHGDCRGADKLAGSVAKELGIRVEKYPADWQRHGKAAGKIRNLTMLQKSNPVLAFVLPQHKCIGTWHMVKIARNAGVSYAIFTM